MKRWQGTEYFNVCGSPPNIHSPDNGLSSLSLHALLPRSDINTLMPASSQSTLSFKKDELRVRTHPFPCLSDNTYQTRPQSSSCVSHPRKMHVVVQAEREIGNNSHFSTMESSPWSLSNSEEFWGLSSTFPVFLPIWNYFHVPNTRIFF